MKLYHGTNVNFDKIDFSKSNPFKDFGKGFYLTDIKTQAQALATKRALLQGGVPTLLEYDFDEELLTNSSLNVLIFKEATAEWAEFVYNNRNRRIPFKHNFDIVVGPIADDGVAYLLNRYQEGSFTIEELADKLKYLNINNQYFFGTELAISFLKRVK